jgi:hypothetical protein
MKVKLSRQARLIKKRVEPGQLYYHVEFVLKKKAKAVGLVLGIGVFGSRKRAEEIVKVLRAQPGFKSSLGKFWISRGLIDQVSWSEGFVTLDELVKDGDWPS